jgi:hypothetical protein
MTKGGVNAGLDRPLWQMTLKMPSLCQVVVAFEQGCGFGRVVTMLVTRHICIKLKFLPSRCPSFIYFLLGFDMSDPL